jgi:glycosyltransferase involved in cell wall biosynthesis
MAKAKVLFTFYALPPYLISLLNVISEQIEVTVILPEQSQISKGKSVYESFQGIEFEIIRLPSKVHWLTHKEILKGISQTIYTLKPHFFVTCWPYILQIAFNYSLRKFMQKNGIQWGVKHIPYQLPYYPVAMKFYKEKGIFDEQLTVQKADNLKRYIKFFFLKELNKYLFRSVDFHLCYLSESPKILQSYGVNPEKVIVTYNSGDTPKLFEAYQWSQTQFTPETENFRFIFVGRLVKWKKVDILLLNFSKLVKIYSHIRLMIVGDGPEFNTLKNLASELLIQNYVEFTGGIYDYKELAMKFKQSHVFVLTGAGGLSINDAMTFAKPVICTHADGTEKDLVIPHQTGFIYENEKELLNYMEFFILNPQIATQMGQNAQNKILNEINLNSVASKYINFFLKRFPN